MSASVQPSESLQSPTPEGDRAIARTALSSTFWAALFQKRDGERTGFNTEPQAIFGHDVNMTKANVCCHFCRKSYTEVGPLVEGPDAVYICGECIELCQAIMIQEQRRRRPPAPLDAIGLRQRLDKLVVGQEEAKQAFIQALALRERPAPILLAGASSAAKILLARAVAHLLEVPFAKGPVSALLPAQDNPPGLPPVLFDLIRESDFDLDAARRGVAYIEGAESPACQRAILQFCETETFEPHARIPFNPAGIFLICGANVGPSEPFRGALERADAVPQWLERLSAIAYVDPLDEAALTHMAMSVDFGRLL